jgi:hypothetical protein
MIENTDTGKPTLKFKRRPKQQYRNSDGTSSGYSGTIEGERTISAKRLRLSQNQGPSGHYKNKKR